MLPKILNKNICLKYVTFHRKRSTFQNVWRQSSGTFCTWTLTSNVLKSTPFPMERHIYIPSEIFFWIGYCRLDNVWRQSATFCTRNKALIGKLVPILLNCGGILPSHLCTRNKLHRVSFFYRFTVKNLKVLETLMASMIGYIRSHCIVGRKPLMTMTMNTELWVNLR